MGGMTADEGSAKQISELEARRYQAMTDADTATLGELLAADFVYTHSDTKTDSRQSLLAKVASGALDYGPLEHPEISILTRGDCALVFGDMRGDVHIDGELRRLNNRVLAVWVREDGRWVLLAVQPTRYPA
jgi:ketosteroid isomerase-like protein